jgi:biopolymer transport protein ExbB
MAGMLAIASFIARDYIMGSSGCARARLARFLFLSLLGLFLLGVLFPDWQTARAQPENAPGSETGESQGPPNLFKHVVKSAGVFFGPLLLAVSIGLVALIVLLAMDLRMIVAIPPQFVEEFTDTVNKKRFKEAFELARANQSFLGRVITAGMGRLQYGIEDAREAAFNTVESMKASKEQLITYLATIGTLGPMLGLVGTVFGMILSFMELGRGSQPNPAKLADGISHALVVTLLGVALSVPAIFTHAFFRNRLIRISMDTANIADDLLTQMYHSSRKPGAAETRPSAPATTPAAAVKSAT